MTLSFSLVNLLYYVSFGFLLGMAGFVFAKNPRAWLHRVFAVTALSLLSWQATLFLFNHTTGGAIVLWLGRANFAAMVFVVYFAWLLVRAIARLPLPHMNTWLFLETLALAAVSGFTPLIDRAEIAGVSLEGGVSHVTHYGPLFPVYLIHVTAFLLAALSTAFRDRQIQTGDRTANVVRDQLLLVGVGILATGFITLVTNVLLPYGFNDFHFIDVGTLSTFLFLASVAYAIIRHHLFDLRWFIRKTLVYGLLLSVVLAVYSALALFVTDHLAEKNANGLTRFGVLLIASSFDPIRRYLEKQVDHLLFWDDKSSRSPAKVKRSL